MPLPNFFIVGAPKCGTTALYEAMKQHPDIYMGRVKEPAYFAFGGVRPEIQPGPAGAYLQRSAVWRSEDYLLLYADGKGYRAIGDATPLYLRSSQAAHGIRAAAPKSKIVAILRQPAERAYSSYLYMVEKGVENALTFSEALAQEHFKIEHNYFSGLYHQQNGFYQQQLNIYYQLFSRDQIKVFLYEDWNASPQKVLQELFEFLEVDTAFQPALWRSNVTRVPRSRRLHYIARHPEWLGENVRLGQLPPVRRAFSSLLSLLDTRYNLKPPAPLDPNLRAFLTRGYREDILQLQELIGRDLSHWL
jgi:hypothetical protein